MPDTVNFRKKIHPVVEIFRDKESAQLAYRAIYEMGYDNTNVNLLLSDETRKRDFPCRSLTQGQSIESTGAPDRFGAIATTIATTGMTLRFPGLWLVISGPLTAATSCASLTSLSDGLVNVLMSWDIPEEHARYYEQGIKDGGVLIAMRAHHDEDAKAIGHIWNEIFADQVHS